MMFEQIQLEAPGSTDEHFMAAAISLAGLGRGAVEPNPMEGAVMARGGGGTPVHCDEALGAGADAVLDASVFHFGILSIAQVKESIRAHGHPVR